MELFIAFLNLCREQGMIGNFDGNEQRLEVLRHCNDFVIDADFSLTVVDGGMILKGAFSDGNVSVHLADYRMLLGGDDF